MPFSVITALVNKKAFRNYISIIFDQGKANLGLHDHLTRRRKLKPRQIIGAFLSVINEDHSVTD